MKYLYIVYLLIAFQMSAQKQIEQQIEGSSIKNIVINGNEIFKIKINTHENPVVKVNAFIEGEHNEYIILDTEKKLDTLNISTHWHPLFVDDNDKLSAHKVISIELEILLPTTINLYLKSDIASAIIKGYYKELIIELIDGNCDLETQAQYTKINTIEGNINVLTTNTAVEAATKNGNQDIDVALNGNNKMLLNTLNGNIIVRKQ